MKVQSKARSLRARSSLGGVRVRRTTGPEKMNDDTTRDEEKQNFKATGRVQLKGEKTSINIYFLMLQQLGIEDI